jgi:hypothetical protein
MVGLVFFQDTVVKRKAERVYGMRMSLNGKEESQTPLRRNLPQITIRCTGGIRNLFVQGLFL